MFYDHGGAYIGEFDTRNVTSGIPWRIELKEEMKKKKKKKGQLLWCQLRRRDLKYAGFMQTVPETGKTSILGRKSAAGMMSTDNAVCIPHSTAYLLIYIGCSICLVEVQRVSMWQRLGLKAWAGGSSYLSTLVMMSQWDRWHLSSLRLLSEKDRLSLRSIGVIRKELPESKVFILLWRGRKKKKVSGFYKAVDPKKGGPLTFLGHFN